jgi:hypothetical protein
MPNATARCCGELWTSAARRHFSFTVCDEPRLRQVNWRKCSMCACSWLQTTESFSLSNLFL